MYKNYKMSRMDHTSLRSQRNKHTGRHFQAVTSEGIRQAWYCTVLKMRLAACAASCGHRGHSPAALASLFVSSTELQGSDPRGRPPGGRGGRWASPSPPGPADSCNARRAEPAVLRWWRLKAWFRSRRRAGRASVSLGVGTSQRQPGNRDETRATARPAAIG